jgi:hypothetical protein
MPTITGIPFSLLSLFIFEPHVGDKNLLRLGEGKYKTHPRI